MNKSELVDTIAQRTSQSSAKVNETLSALQEVISESVKKGEKVTIPGFVSFEQTERSARTGRNPRTGETIKIPATKAVKVSAGAKLKEAAKG